MKKFVSWFFENFNKVYVVSLFLIAFIIIVYLFPGVGKFRYEFQKGQPWLHKDLIAPFDFAIYKMNDELAQEKDDIIKSLTPYYNRESSVSNEKMLELDKVFQDKFNKLKLQGDSLSKLMGAKKLKVAIDDSILVYYDIVKTALEEVYQKGVIELYDDSENTRLNSGIITVVDNKLSEQYEYNTLFTLKSAYKYVVDKLSLYANNSNPNLYIEFIKSLQIEGYIVPTLYYDVETTEKAKNDLFEGISMTKGMVQEGERIISQGEMIDNNRFRVLESLKKEYMSSLDSKTNRLLILVGKSILVAMVFILLLVFLFSFKKDVLESRRKTFFILSLIVLFVILSKVVYHIDFISIYLIPFAILPILISTFFDSRLALFAYLVTVLLSAFYAPNSFEFIFINIVSGVVTVITLKKIQRRGDFFGATGLTMISYFLLYFGISINQAGSLDSIEWVNFAWFAGNGILLLLSFPFIYFVEKTFKFLSNITLMEMSDTNQKLLRTLAENAPGTFQHSMQVANLSEEVIRNIGGNPLLIRTGALYHDIGKLSNYDYFTENQLAGKNPHDQLSYIESAEIIISHVTSGVEMAKKAKLPEPIIDFIKTHHGTSKVQYFYRLHKQENSDGEKDAHKFTYPGPKPFSKETAVLMMSDSIEAASRSLKEYTKESIDNLVENIINFQIKEKQFDDADINFAEISKAKEVLKNKLQNIYHTRIAYPKEKEDSEKSKE